MIPVAEAKAIIEKSIIPLPPVELPLIEAMQHVLAQDVFTKIDIPAFAQSSMDGYAFRFSDRNTPLKICGEMAAGSTQNIKISKGESVRIFTGAPLPDGADTVVMQEKMQIVNDTITISDKDLKEGSNVREQGAEIKAGAKAMSHGNLLSPAAIGFIAGIGETSVQVYPMPSVSIIVTGKELQTPGQPLSAGQVYESNSFMLRAALQQVGITKIEIVQAADDLKILKNILATELNMSDVILITGGVSVGDYDFVIEATKLCGVQQCFHKVKQRPGKPLYFGMKQSKVVFGLPGNPSSVLSCFYNYVLPALEKLSNKKNSIQKLRVPLTMNVSKPRGLTNFLKGLYKEGMAKPLGAQESFRLSSFAQANCLICLEEEKTDFVKGDVVDVYLLPGIH